MKKLLGLVIALLLVMTGLLLYGLAHDGSAAAAAVDEPAASAPAAPSEETAAVRPRRGSGADQAQLQQIIRGQPGG